MEAIIRLGISTGEHGINRQAQHYRGIFAVCLQQTTEPHFLRIFATKQICDVAKGKSIMNRTRISWVRNPDGTQGYTWNPGTGCLHNCDYCYARKMSLRFEGFPIKTKFVENAAVEQIINGKIEEFILDENPGFVPTFWTSRLEDPLRLRKPSTIFVCSMADLFGDWVPVEWIEQILKVVRDCPQHTFLFLTKNPNRYESFLIAPNSWIGYTTTSTKKCCFDFRGKGHFFVSAEPLLGEVYIKYYLGWAIIGSLNQNSKPVSPEKGGTKKEWVLSLLDQADKHTIPVFIKPDLYELYPDLPQRQELPYLKK